MIDRATIAEDELMELVIEAGAEDMLTEADYYEVLTAPEAFSSVSEAVRERGLSTQLAEVRFVPIPGTEVAVDGEEEAAKLMKFLDILEEHDDVQAVFHNASIPDAVLEALAAG